jgi:hypothetical protein
MAAGLNPGVRSKQRHPTPLRTNVEELLQWIAEGRLRR